MIDAILWVVIGSWWAGFVLTCALWVGVFVVAWADSKHDSEREKREP